MARVVHLADSHFCESSRFEECCALHDWIADWVDEERPDVVVHAGDVYERASTPRERLEAAAFFRRCAEHAPVVIVRGNHDRDEDLTLLAKLRSRFPIVVRDTPGVVDLHRVEIACLPWPRKSALLAALGNVPQEQAGQVAQEALRDVLRGLRDDEARKPRLLVAHAMVRGSVTSHGQPLIGHDMELGLDDLDLAQCDGVALGHVHAHQSWERDGFSVAYSGSPRRTAFGESEDKGFLVWDPDGNGPAGFEFIKLPCAPMHLIEAHWYSEYVGLPGDVVVPAGFSLFGLDDASVFGSEIRLRYHVESEHREAAARSAAEFRDMWLSDGATVVKLEPVVEVSTRARAPEVAQARTLRDQLDAHWESKGGAPDRREPMLRKITELEDSIGGSNA